MEETLNHIERRVLGALIEKALAQPQYYPMTLNAVVAACNQKSNRDPVLSLDEDAVWDTLERLRAVGLVSRIMPGGASRVERFRHEVQQLLGWEKPQRAVMAELLLRGPQTVGELRGRCARMYPFENAEMVAAVLESLNQADPPRVATLPRGSGQSVVRYAHRLYEPGEWASLSQSPASGVPPMPTPATQAGAPAVFPDAGSSAVTSAAAASEVQGLRNELDGLQTEVAELHELIAELQKRVERLES